MKVFLLFAVFIAVAAATMTVTEDLVQEVNKGEASWVAGHNQFSNMTRSDARRMLGLRNHSTGKTRPTMIYDKKGVKLPTSFDWRQKMPSCIHPVQDQGQCGSCWAFGSTESLADRFCIVSQGKVSVVLAAQDPVSCDDSDMGCNGGYLDNVYEYFVNTGVVTKECMPYTAGTGVVDECPSGNKCTGKGTWKKYKAKNSYDVDQDVDTIMKEIYTNGPVLAGFEVYQDFFAYTKGVYVHKTGGLDGGHAIEIVGWGHDEDSGLDYWIVKNSWAKTWGMDGYFWIKKGSNECGIEAQVVAGLPKLDTDKPKNPLDRFVHDKKIIDAVNNDPTSTWKAGYSTRFAGKTIRDAQKLLGAKPAPKGTKVNTVRVGKLPDEFDWRKESSKCVHPIRDQQQCGSCWAFGASESLSDRLCIGSDGKIDVVLSAEDLVACDTSDNGCSGGYLQNAWDYMHKEGLVPEDCIPYSSGTGHVPSCPSKCTGSGEWKKYYTNETATTYKEVDSQMTVLHASGPIEASFAVYQDFMSYTSGIYTHKSGPLMGYHAVKVVGWGEQSGTKYWIVANSWGKGWGMDGYFMIKRGSDECMFEENMVAALPKV